MFYKFILWFCLLYLQSLADKWDPDYLEDDIYYWVSGESPCVRLSTRYNRTGCATSINGDEARLRYISNETDVQNLIDENPQDDIAIVLPLEIISREIIDNLTNSLHSCKGIIFLQFEEDDLKPPSSRTGYSPDSSSPMYYLRPSSHGDNIYFWNSVGEFLMFEDFPFAIVLLKKSQSSKIQSWAQENERLIKEDKFALNYVEFTYPMQASNTTLECLSSQDCLPLGGYSVWTTFNTFNTSNDTSDDSNSNNNNNNNNTKQYIFGVTSMDTTALFHENFARGADANQAGLIAFLAAISALSGIKDVITNLEKQIIFVAFQGESYDLLGSRKFIYDISDNNFKCEEYMTSYASGCWKPYSTSLDFLNLHLNQTYALIELQQTGIAKNNQRIIYTHYKKNLNNSDYNQIVDNIIDDLINIAQNISIEQNEGFEVKKVNNSQIVGTPPSSYWSFLKGSANLPGIVLTDHENEYSNKWYHSVYDSFYNDLNREQICMTGTLFARILYKLAAGNDYNETFAHENINVDCILVETLLECFTQDETCDLVTTIASSARDSTPSHYTSIYRIIEDQLITGDSQFIFRYLANLTRRGDIGSSCSKQDDCFDKNQVCGGTNDGTYCMKSSTYYHAAVDPNLDYDYDSETWKLSANDDKKSLLWSESNWPANIGTRFYVKESPTTAKVILICGLSMFTVSLFITWRMTKYCQNKFKILN